MTDYVTNGSLTADALDEVGPYLDAYRVDIKGFSMTARISKGLPRSSAALWAACCAALCIGVSAQADMPREGELASVESEEFIKPPEGFFDGLKPENGAVTVAKTPPRVDFILYPGQRIFTDQESAQGARWSIWGDGCLASNGKFYSAMGDHRSPTGECFLFEYDPERRELRKILDFREFLGRKEGQYSPGKIHAEMTEGKDGWIYISTYPGLTRGTSREYGYVGDWLLRYSPAEDRTELIGLELKGYQYMHSALDAERMMWYGLGAPSLAAEDKRNRFLAYDLTARKVAYVHPDGADYFGPYSVCAITLDRRDGVWFSGAGGRLVRYNPDSNDLEWTNVIMPGCTRGRNGRLAYPQLMEATEREFTDGWIYAFTGRHMFRFQPLTQKMEPLRQWPMPCDMETGPREKYIYIPRDNLCQYDVETHTMKVLAFLSPAFESKLGVTRGALKNVYCSAITPDGSTLYLGMMAVHPWPETDEHRRDWKKVERCALLVVHIPESERP
jgi:hypothetical protein